ncbi:MAG: conjugal transfer protein TraG [Brachymonas sp.]|nr:conjugal transfer protein TraG [Brachymonas sp.]
MVFEYWSFGNSGALLQLLNGVAAIMSPTGGIIGAVRSVALLAFFLIVTGAALRNDPSPVVNWMIGLAIAWGVMFVPKVTMVVNDRTPNGSLSTYTVDNIPLGLGFVASGASKLNYWLTSQAESAFTLPTYAKFTNVGLMAPQKLLLSMDSMYMRNATLEQDWQQFFNECTWYDMNIYSKRLGLAGFVSHESIAKATNPLTELGRTNNVLFVTTTTGGRATRTCKDSYDILRLATESMANNNGVQQQYAQLAFPGVDSAEALDAFRNSIQYSNQLLTTSSKDISDT